MVDFVLEASHIRCNFAQTDEHIKGVSIDELRIPRVGITVIYGESGSGKSTLLSLLTGSRKPTHIDDDARLCFNSHAIEKEFNLLNDNLSSKGHFGFIFQEPHLIKSISARSNAEIAQTFVGNSIEECSVDDLSRKFNILDIIEQRADTLSGGQAQRVSVIRALALNPEVLVCDEPTSSLDEETGEKLLKHIQDWSHENQKCVLLVTHNLNQAAKFGDYFIRVENGELLHLHNALPLSLIGSSESEKLRFLRTGKLTKPSNEAIPEKIFPNKSTKKASLLGSLFFIWRLVFESLFKPKDHTAYANKFGLLGNLIIKPFANLSVTGLLLTSILVFLSLLKVHSLGAEYFERELAKPELRHFVIEQNLEKLDLKNTIHLKRILKLRLASNNEVLFSRRKKYLQTVLPSADGQCTQEDPQTASDTTSAAMLIFEENEPLFQDFVSRLALSNSDPNMLLALRGTFLDQELETPFLCIEVHGKFISRPVQWIDQAIPGGADRTFYLGMTESSYAKAASEARSRVFQKELYSEAAIYFDEVTRQRILCSFVTEGNCEGLIPFPEEAFHINREVFKQIEEFTIISTYASQVILWLVLSFAFVMSLAVGFSMSAEIKIQEKSLAILRAFGVPSYYISAFFQTRMLVQTLYVVALAFLCVFLVQNSYGSYLDMAIEDFDLSLNFWDVMISCIVVVALTQLTTFCVVTIWALNNKFVSEKLQGL